MSVRLLVSDSPGELRCALVEQGRVVELAHHRPGDTPLLAPGAIVRARVTALAKGFAYLDAGPAGQAVLPLRGKPVQEGQTLTLQIASLPSGADPDKKPVARRRLALAGRTVTAEPGRRIAVSPRFAGAPEAYLAALDGLSRQVRLTLEPAAAAVAPDAVVAEAEILTGTLAAIEGEDGPPDLLLAAPTPLEAAMVRFAGPELGAVVLDSRPLLAEARRLARHMPLEGVALSAWTGPGDLFEAEGVEEAIESALLPARDLPGGGSIAIDLTRGGAVIDVNQAALDGVSLESNRLGLNLAAAAEAAHQIRLQDLAGQILIDFVDLKALSDWDKLLSRLDAALAQDPRPTRRHAVKAAGLVVVNRQRLGPSLRDRMMARPVPDVSIASHALALLRLGLRAAASGPPGPLRLSAPAPVLAWLHARPHLAQDLQSRTGRVLDLREGAAVAADIDA